MAITTGQSHTLDMGGLNVKTKELALGATDAAKAPTITLTGTVANAGTGANSAGVSTGGVASKVLTVDVGGTTYYIGLFSSNA